MPGTGFAPHAVEQPCLRLGIADTYPSTRARARQAPCSSRFNVPCLLTARRGFSCTDRCECHLSSPLPPSHEEQKPPLAIPGARLPPKPLIHVRRRDAEGHLKRSVFKPAGRPAGQMPLQTAFHPEKRRAEGTEPLPLLFQPGAAGCWPPPRARSGGHTAERRAHSAALCRRPARPRRRRRRSSRGPRTKRGAAGREGPGCGSGRVSVSEGLRRREVGGRASARPRWVTERGRSGVRGDSLKRPREPPKQRGNRINHRIPRVGRDPRGSQDTVGHLDCKCMLLARVESFINWHSQIHLRAALKPFAAL